MGSFLSHVAFFPPHPSYDEDFCEWLDGEVPFKLEGPDEPTETVLIVSHGNACDLGHTLGPARAFRKWTGAAVATYDYPGYGPRACSSDGVWGVLQRTWNVSFRGAADNLRRVLAEVRARGYTRIFLVGWSIGSGPTCDVAAEEGDSLAGVILLTPVYSAINTQFNARWPLTTVDAITNHLLVPRITARLSVIHGTADTVVPFDHGRRLHAMAPNPGWFLDLVGADHNDLFMRPYIEFLQQFMVSETA